MLNYNLLENNIYYFKFSNINNEEFSDYCNYFESLFKKNINLKIIFDLSELSLNDLFYSKKKIEFMKKNYNNTLQYIQKTAIIISNNTIKNLINTCIFSIYKPTKPNIITNNINDAMLFLK
tara:strand:+ start:66 stop:428 length:363 start_codon:yes stop_codon:yes gene_type:complete